MPARTPQLGSYQHVQETKVSGRLSTPRDPILNTRALTTGRPDWADLITIDLSFYPTPGGKEELARTLITAVREKGFFYVKNFNISQERVNTQFSIGRDLYDLPLEEKKKYTVEGLDHGKFNGYVPAGRRMCAQFRVSEPELHQLTGLKSRGKVWFEGPGRDLQYPPSSLSTLGKSTQRSSTITSLRSRSLLK